MGSVTNSFEDKIKFVDDVIIYEPAIGSGWSLSLTEVKVIGELTTREGAVVGDWFFVFVIDENNWRFSTAYLNQDVFNSFWKQISLRLNCEILPSLFYSSDLNSQVLYPKSLEGNELFLFKEVATKNHWQAFKKLIGLGKEISFELNEKVKAYLLA